MGDETYQSAYIFAFLYSLQIGTILTTYLWPLLALIFGLINEYSLFRFPYSTMDRKRVWIMVRSTRLYHWPLPSSSLFRDRINISVAGKKYMYVRKWRLHCSVTHVISGIDKQSCITDSLLVTTVPDCNVHSYFHFLLSFSKATSYLCSRVTSLIIVCFYIPLVGVLDRNSQLMICT